MTGPALTAVQAEAAWLTADAAVASAVGPVIAYGQRTSTGLTSATLRRDKVEDTRVSIGRLDRVHSFVLQVAWPAETAAYTVADAQADLDVALDALLARIHDQQGDHTHGGLFVSVAEDEDPQGNGQPGVTVTVAPPPVGDFDTPQQLTATVRYQATEQILDL